MSFELLFDNPSAAQVGTPEILKHGLNRYFPELLKFDSSDELESSSVYQEIREDAERILNAVVVGALPDAAPTSDTALTDVRASAIEPNIDAALTSDTALTDVRGSAIKALAWNIERGCVFDGIVKALKNHDELKDKDVLLLTELDHGMARSGNRFVAREVAEELKLNYAFAPVYLALQKGSGVESAMEGENTLSIHGLAMFSKWPMKNTYAVALPNGKDKMWGKEKRLGHLRALVSDIEHPSGDFRAITVHLDAHCSRSHRHRQMKIILDHLETLPELPTLIGGDWNTTTFNAQNSTRAILGYWRRVMMGVKNVVKNHYPHPDRYFERRLFAELEKQGFHYRELNESGAGTIHYDVDSIEKNTNLRDWVPEWCFPFIFWAANRVGGRVSSRLDWFAGKGVGVADNTTPKTIGNLKDESGTPLSDHDAITLDFLLQKPARK